MAHLCPAYLGRARCSRTPKKSSVAPAPPSVRLDDILYGFGQPHENTPLVSAGRTLVVTPPTKPRRSHGYLSQDATPASDSSTSASESRSTDYRIKSSWGALPVGGTTMATTRYLADAQLETADARHPANVPMLVVRGYTPTPRRATQGHVTVERGAVVNALYKLADWLFVRTADDAVGFIPRVCVEAIGPRTARDFGQQFPERNGDDIGARRGRASFSPTNTTTTTASSDGDGGSGDESGASLRDAFGFLHLRKGTPSPPPPPPPPPPARWRDGLTSRQSRAVRGGVTKHGHTKRIYSAEEDGDLTSRHDIVDAIDIVYVPPPSLAARKSRQPNGLSERHSRRSPLTVPEREKGQSGSNDTSHTSADQPRSLYQKALPSYPMVKSNNGSRRRRRYRAMANNVSVRYRGSKSAGDDDGDDDSLSDGTGARSLFEVALESSDNCSVCRSQYMNVRNHVQYDRPASKSPSNESRQRRRRAQTDPENGFADSDRPSGSDHSPRGSGTDYHHQKRRDHSCCSDQPRRSDSQQCNGETQCNGDHVHREDQPRNGDHRHRENHRSGSGTRRRSASATRRQRATLTVVFDHVSQTEGDIDVRRGDIVRLLSDADSRCYWVRREVDGRKGFIPKSCAVNLREFNLDPSTKTTYL